MADNLTIAINNCDLDCILNWFETPLLFATGIAISAVFSLLCQINTIHFNTKIFCFNMLIGYFLWVVKRYVTLFHYWTNANQVLFFYMSDTTLSDFFYTAHIFLVIERTIATLNYRTYESRHDLFPMLFLVALSWSVAIGMAFGYHNLGSTGVATIISLNMLFNIGAIVMNIALLHHNRHLIDQIQRSSNIALSERYQLNENVRTVRVFNVLTVAISITNVATTMLAMILLYVIPSQSAAAVHLIYILNSTTVLSLSIAAMRTNEAMRKILRKTLMPFSYNQAAPVSTVTGKRLVVEQTPDNHFEQLRSSWR